MARPLTLGIKRQITKQTNAHEASNSYQKHLYTVRVNVWFGLALRDGFVIGVGHDLNCSLVNRCYE